MWQWRRCQAQRGGKSFCSLPEERAFELRFEIGFLAKRTHGFFQGLEARAERDVNRNRYVAEKEGKGERKGWEPGGN